MAVFADEIECSAVVNADTHVAAVRRRAVLVFPRAFAEHVHTVMLMHWRGDLNVVLFAEFRQLFDYQLDLVVRRCTAWFRAYIAGWCLFRDDLKLFDGVVLTLFRKVNDSSFTPRPLSGIIRSFRRLRTGEPSDS